MAVTLTKNPWIFTAAADTVASTIFEPPFKIDRIIVYAGGTGGSTEVLDAAAGSTIIQAYTAAADAVDTFDIYAWVDGIYINAIPSGGEIHVFHTETPLHWS